MAKDRFTIKIAGAAGQGIKSSGEIISKALKRSGFYTFGYTEYPSLIRGGHNVFQIEVSDRPIASVTKDTDVLLALNKESVDLHIDEFDKDTGVLILDQIIHINPDQEAKLKENNVKIFNVPLLDLATQAGGNALMKNTVSLGAIWKTLGLEIDKLLDIIGETYNKTQEMVEINQKAAKLGFDFINEEFTRFANEFKADTQIQDDLVISGNEAMALSAIASGINLYSSYPMTPTSSLLTHLAEMGPKYQVLVKQAEDEITAANMCIGANFAGARALCATSGGGADLMSESISLAGISETPFVLVLGQRHGAATGAPTWTGQSDLFMALNAGHGEFPRVVISVSSAEDSFYLLSQAFNLAEKYQLPVIVLTEKYIAESFYTVKTFDQSKIVLDRGQIKEASSLTGEEMRYEITESGISPRWLPGMHSQSPQSIINSTFLSNSDEHTPKGYSTENEKEIKSQVEKRMRKLESLRGEIPQPTIYGKPDATKTIITWGSNLTSLIDLNRSLEEQGTGIKIIHYTYLWPFAGEILEEFRNSSDNVFVLEQNATGQLAKLIKQETGIEIKNKIIKYDSRPFYIEELFEKLS